MKKKILDLVADYQKKEKRIEDLNEALRARNLNDGNVQICDNDDADPLVSEIEFEKGEQLNRLLSFLGQELKIEKENLGKIDLQIAKQFKEEL